jgi:hypothetical protein
MNLNNLAFTDGALRSEKSTVMTKYNPEYPRPILNERVQHATEFTEISEQDRQDAADRLAELIESAREELE